MSSNSLPQNNFDDVSNYPELSDVILKETEFLSLIDQYDVVNKQYLDELKKSTPSRQILYGLLEDLTIINTSLKEKGQEINRLKEDKFANFNNNIEDKNTLVTSNITSIINNLQKEGIELSKLKQRVSDAEGINKEYTSEIKSTNYKYLFLLLVIIFLILSIILSITLPYKTNLESNLFIVLCIVVIYYLYLYIRQYKYDVAHKVNTQYGNVKSFLKIN